MCLRAKGAFTCSRASGKNGRRVSRLVFVRICWGGVWGAWAAFHIPVYVLCHFEVVRSVAFSVLLWQIAHRSAAVVACFASWREGATNALQMRRAMRAVNREVVRFRELALCCNSLAAQDQKWRQT